MIIAPTFPPILVVDDNPEELFTARCALRDLAAKYPVISFGSGPAARNYLQRWLAITSRPPVARSVLLVALQCQQSLLALLGWIRTQDPLKEVRIVVFLEPGDQAGRQCACHHGATPMLPRDITAAALSAVFGDSLQVAAAGA